MKNLFKLVGLVFNVIFAHRRLHGKTTSVNSSKLFGWKKKCNGLFYNNIVKDKKCYHIILSLRVILTFRTFLS